ncbi:MAG: hypothetical protein Q4D06_10030 [Coriobacteriia bacterium]|nr:hypothetical protein [Coriobacteriia bacterium]
MRVAIIDIGSNTAHMCVYDVPQDVAGYRPKRVFKVKKQLGLAAYVDESGCLSAEGEQRCGDAVEELAYIARTSGIDRICAFATAAIRQAENGREVAERVGRRCGLEIEVISSRQEALMGFQAISHELDLDHGVLVDIGGGSSEVVRFAGGHQVLVLGMPLGSLRLFRDYVDDVLPSAKERVRMEDAVEGSQRKPGWAALGESDVLCAIGGSSRAALKLIRRCCPEEVLGSSFSSKALDDLLDRFAKDRRFAVRAITQVCPDRVHTVIPGMLILRHLCHSVRAERIVVGSFGVREGYLLERIVGERVEEEGQDNE